MKSLFPQENNLLFQNEEQICFFQNSYSIKQIYYQDYSSQQNSFDLESNLKYKLTSFDHIIYEPEYFLNAQSLDEQSKINHECTSPSTQSSFQDNQLTYLTEQKPQSIIKFYNIDAFIQNEQSDLNQAEDWHVKHSQHKQGLSYDFNCKNTNVLKISSNRNDNNNNSNENIQINQTQFIAQLYENEKQTFEYFQSQKQQINEQQYQEDQQIQMMSSKKQEKLKYSVSQQNSLKNIVFAFISSVKKMKYCEIMGMKTSQFQNYKKQLIRYFKQHSFNQSVVKYLTTHKFYSLLLLNYLENESPEWLRNSKVADKEEVKAQVIQLITTIKNQTSNQIIIN